MSLVRSLAYSFRSFRSRSVYKQSVRRAERRIRNSSKVDVYLEAANSERKLNPTTETCETEKKAAAAAEQQQQRKTKKTKNGTHNRGTEAQLRNSTFYYFLHTRIIHWVGKIIEYFSSSLSLGLCIKVTLLSFLFHWRKIKHKKKNIVICRTREEVFFFKKRAYFFFNRERRKKNKNFKPIQRKRISHQRLKEREKKKKSAKKFLLPSASSRKSWFYLDTIER